MSYKKLQTMHEIRMWIKEIIIPATAAGIIVASNPQVRQAVGNKVTEVKKAIKKKFKRGEKET
jgi:archaellum component FlaG (FlaF/FlaG flagellin family)